jgi:hypothetical protein
MTKNLFVAVLLPALLLLGIPACSKKTDAKAELEKAAHELATATAPAEPAPEPAPEPAQPDPAVSAIPQAPAEQTAAAPATPPAQQMQQALVAYKTGELEDAVTRLQKLRSVRSLTPQQRMAVQDSVAAVMTEIYSLAEKGNQKAIAAVKQYEQMQTMPR